MKLIKKYLAIFVLLAILPITWLIGKSFITESDTEIYSYIPQESDIVIEINSRNFVSEIMYQRVYNEDYILKKIELEKSEIQTGIDYFSKVILFREAWAEENIWIAVLSYTDKEIFKKYAENIAKDTKVVFGEKHAIIQLTKSANQAKMDEHLKNISTKNIKPFTARVDLQNYFKAEKEVNIYLIPQSANINTQLLDGYVNMDFHKDHIDIDGEFNTASNFDQTPAISYSIDNDKAFSLRSSLNIFKSIWWFSDEKIENVPQYNQMALDYDGVNFFLVNRNWGYPFPFKTFPEVQLKFDISKNEEWEDFFATIKEEGKIEIDTTTNILITEQGAFFQYNINEDVFELSRSGINLDPNLDPTIYFDFQMKIADLLDRTNFAIDEDNPPSAIEQTIGMSIAEEMIDELHVFDNIEQIRFQLSKGKESKVQANGKVQMKNHKGQSIVESMFFMTEALLFVRDF